MSANQFSPKRPFRLLDNGTVEITLTRGQTTIIDIAHVDLAEYKWYAKFYPKYANGGAFMAARNYTVGSKRKVELLHRVILSRVLDRPLLSHEQVDHADLNTLNNLMSNLRIADHSQNAANQRRMKTNTSGFKGVTFKKETGKWQAQICIRGVRKSLGAYDTPELAYEAYCAEASKARGVFVRLE